RRFQRAGVVRFYAAPPLSSPGLQGGGPPDEGPPRGAPCYTLRMAAAVRPLIGVVGDFDPGNATHRFTNAALDIAGAEFAWIATEDVEQGPSGRLAAYDGF